MSIQKVNHNVIRPFTDQALAAVGVGDNATSEWLDVSGLTDKKVSWEIDSAGAIDVDIIAHVSPLGAYELNHKTASTEDYVAVTIVEAHVAAIMVSVDASDVDDLQRPFRSVRFNISNDSAAAVTGMSLWIEGWS